MIAYKVVEIRNNVPGSCNQHFNQHSPLLMEYHDGEVVIAPRYTMGLFIFLDYQKARSFANYLMSCDKHICAIKEVEVLSKVTLRLLVMSAGDVADYSMSTQRYRELKAKSHIAAPSETYTCRKLRVIKTIGENHEER